MLDFKETCTIPSLFPLVDVNGMVKDVTVLLGDSCKKNENASFLTWKIVKTKFVASRGCIFSADLSNSISSVILFYRSTTSADQTLGFCQQCIKASDRLCCEKHRKGCLHRCVGVLC